MTALILLITISHFYPLNSMLKVLVCAYVSCITLACIGQPSMPEWSSPSDLVTEDPNKIIADLTSVIPDSTRVLLTWKVDGGLPEFFAIERSDNGKSYEVVTVLNNLDPKSHFQWIDDAPKKEGVFIVYGTLIKKDFLCILKPSLFQSLGTLPLNFTRIRSITSL